MSFWTDLLGGGSGTQVGPPLPEPERVQTQTGGSGLIDRLRGTLGGVLGGGSGSGGVWAGANGGGSVQAGAPVPSEIVCERVPGVAFQCPPDYRVQDPILESMTEGTLMGALVRLTAGYQPSSRTFSRTRISAQISNDLELGWAHAATVEPTWMGRDVIRKFARNLPQAQIAWGPLAATLASDAGSNEVIDLFLGKTTLPDDPRAIMLIAGWNALSQTQGGQRIYTDEWHRSKVQSQINKMKELGWKEKRTLAALVRLRNSGRQWMITDNAALGEAAAVEAGLDQYVAEKSSRQNDVDRIRSWPEFQGTITSWPKASDLRFQGPVGVTSTATGQGSAPFPGASGGAVPPGGVQTNGGIAKRTGRAVVYAAGAFALVALVGGGFALYRLTNK